MSKEAVKTLEANRMVVGRLVEEVIGGGRVELLPSLVDEDHVAHLPLGDHYGPEGLRIDTEGWRVAFPDLTVVLEDLVAENDRVVRRFVLQGTHLGPSLGIAPTGRQARVGGIAIDRLAKGRLVESWVMVDLFGLARQLGSAMPTGATRPGEGPSAAENRPGNVWTVPS